MFVIKSFSSFIASIFNIVLYEIFAVEIRTKSALLVGSLKEIFSILIPTIVLYSSLYNIDIMYFQLIAVSLSILLVIKLP
jgi:hypothetical protein